MLTKFMFWFFLITFPLLYMVLGNIVEAFFSEMFVMAVIGGLLTAIGWLIPKSAR